MKLTHVAWFRRANTPQLTVCRAFVLQDNHECIHCYESKTIPAFSGTANEAKGENVIYKDFQITLAVAAMATIGTVYGWSSTAAVLQLTKDLSTPQLLLPFGVLLIGIGAGVAMSSFMLTPFGYGKTIAMGLALWGISLLVGSIITFDFGFSTSVAALGIPGGIGVGTSYVTLIGLFRRLFPNANIVGGLIGPLGFACGAIAITLAQRASPSETGAMQVYAGLGTTALLLSALVSRYLSDFSNADLPKRVSDSREKLRDFIYLWTLLFLNVAPGMALVAIAVPWLQATRSMTSGDAMLALCSSLPALPLGQMMWGLIASRHGDKTVFTWMFILRMFAFGIAAWTPSSVSPLLLLVVTLACHGGGFGLIPRKVESSNLRGSPHALGGVLTAWAVGGGFGIWLILPTAIHTANSEGYVGLALTMSAGALLSSRLRRR
ncbi:MULTISPECIES: MFS transporter [Burkholderiaceae]|nr:MULTISPECIES: OFA family MFS transporter [Burkholderiaceae]